MDLIEKRSKTAAALLALAGRALGNGLLDEARDMAKQAVDEIGWLKDDLAHANRPR